ncbi:hypothetical protein SDC9_62261 [bioreactor metagenome]|uniref:Uncharacterized protein n=1 Tax=bioreactor metagenome TaxID=1076179 RepID=A0A644XIV5_9ZZZZ
MQVLKFPDYLRQKRYVSCWADVDYPRVYLGIKNTLERLEFEHLVHEP